MCRKTNTLTVSSMKINVLVFYGTGDHYAKVLHFAI